MKYESNKNPLKKLKNIYNVGDGDEEMGDKLSRISGMKGAEKKSKDKIGKSLNRADPTKVQDRVLKRVKKR